VQRKENRSVSAHRANPPTDRTTVLQSKLYQAAKREPTRRFHALYDKLFVPYVLQSAWEAVARKRGAAGIDQQTLEQIEAAGVPAFLEEIAHSLRAKTYRPQPVRRVAIPKPGDPTATRPLGIPTVRDRVVQAAAKLLLEPIFEADFEGCSFGFRPGKGPPEALAAVAENAHKGFRWVVDADIKQCFDTLDHQLLMTALGRRISDGELLRLIYRWLKAGYLRDGEYYDTDQGSPQGGVLSPLLANVYLHGFDAAQQKQKAFVGRLTRYADDFVIQCGTAEQAMRALEWTCTQLARLSLELHPTKTRVVSDRETGFDFLGFHHRRVKLDGSRKESRGVLRWPSKKACQRFREQVRQHVGPPGRTRSEWGMICRRLGAYLGGWKQYFRHGESARVFAELDEFVLERTARNLARSQPQSRGRKQRRWTQERERLRKEGELPLLATSGQAIRRPPRGGAKVRWRAV
jgi:RNA-directed DNA polymerase